MEKKPQKMTWKLLKSFITVLGWVGNTQLKYPTPLTSTIIDNASVSQGARRGPELGTYRVYK